MKNSCLNTFANVIKTVSRWKRVCTTKPCGFLKNIFLSAVCRRQYWRTKTGGVILRLPIRKNLSTHEKKIVLSSIDTNPTFDKYGEPLFWLDDSMLCNLCYKCNDPNAEFALNKNESSVKCYLGDTGLLVSLAFNENEQAEKFQLK